MRKSSQTLKGFTIVELLVVIAVIGILATISVISYARFQGTARDNQRASDTSVIAEALEKYYDQNGEYPSCAAMQAAGPTVAANTLVGMDPKVLVTPLATSGQTNSINFCTDITTSTPTDSFAYVGDGSTACSTGSACLQFKLEYKNESTGTIVTINSRRTANILTSGDINDLGATPYSFSKINLTWTATGGATSYNIRYATNSSMTSPTSFTPAATTNAAQVTGLTLGTQYWFQVQPATATSTGNWSNTASATTNTLDTPTITALDDSTYAPSQLDYYFNSVANATSYTVNYSTDPSFVSPAPTIVSFPSGSTPTAGSPATVTGLSAGTTVYFRVKSIASGYTSGWSTNASAITQVPTPTCSTSTVNSNSQITPSWGAVTNATSYTLDYATDSGFSSPTTITGIVTTSRAVTGLSNGTTYYFRVKAYIGASFGNTGACPSAATGVDGPTSYGWSADAYGVRNTASVTWMPGAYPGAGNYWSNGMNIYGTCRPGASVVTRLYAYYAYSNNSSQNGGILLDWTWGNQDRYMPGGNDSWKVWWQGWVACQVGGTRAGDTYLGNAGGY